MRVLQLIDNLEAGGAERVAVNYANALTTHIDASFLCATRKEGPLRELVHQDVGYVFLERKHTIDFAAVIRLRNFIKESRIQIVQAHGSSYFIAVLIKILHPDLVLIWHCHLGKTVQAGRFKKWALRVSSFWFNAVFTVNKELLKWSQQHLNKKNTYYIKNFVVKIVQKELPKIFAGKDGKRLICAANLRPDKNHGLLLDAFSIVLKKEPKATLHLYGTDSKDEYSKIILDLVKLQFRGSVFYHGMHPEITALLHAFDIGVLSSDAEGLPLALLEYGQAGLPTVVTDVGQCSEVVNGNAKVVAKGDGRALAEAILELLEQPVLAEEQAKKLQAHIAATFGEEAIVREVIKIYEEQLKDI